MKEVISGIISSINAFLTVNADKIELIAFISVIICFALLIVAFIRSKAEDKKSIIMQLQKKQEDLSESLYKDSVKKQKKKNNPLESHIMIMFGRSKNSIALFSVIFVLIPLVLSVMSFIFLPIRLFFKIEVVLCIWVMFRIASGILYRYHRSKERNELVSALYSIINALKIHKGNIVHAITDSLNNFSPFIRSVMNTYIDDINTKGQKTAGYTLRGYSDDVFWAEMSDILTYSFEYGCSPETAIAALQSNIIYAEQKNKAKTAFEFTLTGSSFISIIITICMVILYPLYHDAIGAVLNDGSIYLLFGLILFQNIILLISSGKDEA